MSTFRVAVSHGDKDHDDHETAHHGPVFDEHYAQIVSDATGTVVDPRQAAQAYRDRFLTEHPDGWTAAVVQLVAAGDDTSTWEEVE